MNKMIGMALAAVVSGAAVAAPVNYDIDPEHTYPSFQADHMGGLSNWRGKINQTSGKVVLDRDAKSGSVDVTMQMASIDFGHEKLNEHAKSDEMFDVAKFPTATFKGPLGKFSGTSPTEIVGQLTLHGVTKPVTLKINQFTCRPHPMKQGVEVCGADASATINRADFGVDYGIDYGFKPEVLLSVQIEALKAK